MAEKGVPDLKRSYAQTLAELSEASSEESPEYADLLEDDDDMPLDLHWYFDQHEVQEADRIKMCRSYASYLSAMMPKNKKPKNQD